MTAYEELWEAQRIIATHWKPDPPPEQALILGLARDALDFISTTGQRHRFRDYRQHQVSSPGREDAPRGAVEAPGTEDLLRRAERFFLELLDAPQPPEEVELIRVVIDALHFIVTTGQLASLEEYIKHLDAGAPPYVVASFASQEEAEAWLMIHPDPPDFAHILVADAYRAVAYDRQRNIRKLPDDHAMEYYLAELRKEEPPVALASFSTREEADAWLKAQPEPARRAWISIGGEFYLAAYYPPINHRALFPLSMAFSSGADPSNHSVS